MHALEPSGDTRVDRCRVRNGEEDSDAADDDSNRADEAGNEDDQTGDHAVVQVARRQRPNSLHVESG